MLPTANIGPTHLTRNLRERCVMARVQRGSRRHYRCFALSRFSTWESAEAAARLWLRPLLASLALCPDDAVGRAGRNRSGVVGVFFRPGRQTLRSGRVAEYPSYVARWPGEPSGVRWRFGRSGGEENAFLRACLSRELRTRDRCRVEWALRSLSAESRAEWLAKKSPTSTPLAECESRGRQSTAQTPLDANKSAAEALLLVA